MSTNGESPATKEDLANLRDELLAAMRKLVYEAETHLLNAFYGFAETNRKRLADLDR